MLFFVWCCERKPNQKIPMNGSALIIQPIWLIFDLKSNKSYCQLHCVQTKIRFCSMNAVRISLFSKGFPFIWYYLRHFSMACDEKKKKTQSVEFTHHYNSGFSHLKCKLVSQITAHAAHTVCFWWNGVYCLNTLLNWLNLHRHFGKTWTEQHKCKASSSQVVWILNVAICSTFNESQSRPPK